MNRAFSILGVREGASLEEIRAAYETRLRKYKSADYDDDPEYVKKKVKELKEAYAAATGSAPVDSPFAKADRRASEKSHHEYEIGRRKAAHAADEDYRESETQKYERKVNHRAEMRKHKSKFEQAGKSIFEKDDFERPKGKRENPFLKLDKPGFEGAPIIGGVQPRKTPDLGKKRALIIVLIIAFLPSVLGVLLNAMDGSFDDYEEQIEYVNEYDNAIHLIAVGMNSDIEDESTYNYDEDWVDESNYLIHKKADEFAKVYFGDNGIENFDDLYNYLRENYEEAGYYFHDEEPMTEKLWTVASIFTLPDKYTCQYLVNPYTNEVVTSDTKYLNYLIDYYNHR